MSNQIETEVVVLGSGPGGYSAAFRAADLGKNVTMIERYESIGGVCLNVGCIPSKALLHIAKVLNEAAELDEYGVDFERPKINTGKMREWKNKVIGQLTSGLKMMAKQRKVSIIRGEGKFINSTEIEVGHQGQKTVIKFQQCIIAAGSLPMKLPFIPEDRRIFDSTHALELEDTQCEMLVIGGGIIGLEMATVYRALGSKISIVEMMDQIIPVADKDVVAPLHNYIKKIYENIMLKTSVVKVETKDDALWVTFDGQNVPVENPKRYDRILVSVGRCPNAHLIGADKAGIKVDERGFISVDSRMKTNLPNIYAIGDIVGNPMLAHKASAEGRLAAEVIAGKKHFFGVKCIPSVAYTDPEVAWVGVTEKQAKVEGIQYKKAIFPWMASGRALCLNRSEGMTKILFDEQGTVIGGAIVGVSAGDLISEVTLAVEMACDAEDLALTIHPHPTLSESIMMAAEVYEGTVTDLYIPKKR